MLSRTLINKVLDHQMTAPSLGISIGFMGAHAHCPSGADALRLHGIGRVVLRERGTRLSQCLWRDSPKKKEKKKSQSIHAGHREKITEEENR